MRRTLIILVAAITLLLLAFKPVLKFSPFDLGDAADVATGLGAKLACSAHFISGFDKPRIIDDLRSYSSAFGLIDLTIEPDQSRVTASLFDTFSDSATFRPGIGCTLDLAGAGQLDTLVAPSPEVGAGPWPMGTEVAAPDRVTQSRLDALLAADNEAGFQSRALLVLRDGNIVAESYAPGIEVDTPLLGWSMGKSVTAMLIGLLEQRGPVDVEQSGLFTEWAADERAGITLLDALQMSTGLRFDEDYSPGTDATRMLSAAPSAAAVAMAQPLVHVPGTHFSYSSGTTNLLALWLHRQVGNSTQGSIDYLHTALLQPLGMRNTYLEPDASGVFVGSSFVYAPARDWARMARLLMAEGNWEGEALLTTGWVEQAQSPNRSANDPRYGYQFWLNRGGDTLRWPDLPEDAYAMLGNRGQVVMMIPSANTAIVRLGWSASYYDPSTRFAALLAP